MRLPRRGLRFVAVVRPGGLAGPSMRSWLRGTIRPGMSAVRALAGASPAALLDSPAAVASTPRLTFRSFADTSLKPDIGWTGQQTPLRPVAGLAPFVGDVLIGSELKGLFGALRPHGDRFEVGRVETTLGGKYNFEGAAYVAG